MTDIFWKTPRSGFSSSAREILLRAFVDYWIDLMNERVGFNSKVCSVSPSRRAWRI